MYLFIVVLSAIFHALVDVLIRHFDESIFVRLNDKFWNPEISSKEAIKIFSIRLDAITICGGINVACLIFTAILCHIKLFRIPTNILPIWAQAFGSICLYITIYNIFLKKVFIKNKT